MSRFNRMIMITALILSLTASAASALDLGGHDRDGMVIGLNLGYGWNSVQLTDSNGLNRDTGDIDTFSGAFKIGWARSDNLVGFIGISGWKRSFYQSLAPASVTNFNFLAEIYYYPSGGGLWVKGGIGTGSLDFYVNTPRPENRLNFREGGFTYTFGTGYEFRVTDAMAFGLSYDYTVVEMGDFDGISDVSTVNHVVGININWYQP